MSYSVPLNTKRWLALIFGLAFFYFYSGGGPNQGSRLDLDRALLEQGHVTIDGYQQNTEDRAFYKAHFYCDKAPGVSFLALPALALSRVAMRFTGIDPIGVPAALVLMHVATWSASTIPAVILCLILFDWTLRKGHSRVAAAYAALALGLASPMWAYATLFWGNALAACCVLYATCSIDKLSRQTSINRGIVPAFLAGVATGGAVITEYPTAPMAGILLVLLLVKLRPWRLYWRRLLAYGTGALIVALVLCVYNFSAFGSPFHLGYASVQGWNGMSRGLFGVTRPSMQAIAGVIWGPRGLLLTAPLLVLGLLGHFVSIARRQNTMISVICLIFSVYPVLLNVSYVYWDGGWTYGPRHLSAALPFMALGLAPLYDALQTYFRPMAIAVLAGAAFLTMIAVSVHGMTPYQPKNPWPDLYWPSFWTGKFAIHQIWLDSGGPATNLGLALGLANAQSLIPLWVGLGVGLTGLGRSLYHTRVE